MKVLMLTPIKVVETIKHILAGMRVDDIEEHRDAHTVGSVDQCFQVLGRSLIQTR